MLAVTDMKTDSLILVDYVVCIFFMTCFLLYMFCEY